jgi:hypothetical protein
MVTVDFVTTGETEWQMVLVEQGPWSDSIDEHLRRVSGTTLRMPGCRSGREARREISGVPRKEGRAST